MVFQDVVHGMDWKMTWEFINVPDGWDALVVHDR